MITVDWDERYNTSEYVYGKLPNAFLAENTRRIPAGGRVLCLAEGEGRNATFLATQGFQVHGVDQSTTGLAKAQKLAAEKGVTITTAQADLCTYQIEGQWDGIVSIFSHLLPEYRARLHRQVVEALAPNGIFILIAYTPEQLQTRGQGGPGPDSEERLMRQETIAAELKGLSFEILTECKITLDEGSHHAGEAAVLQVCARKKPLK